MAQFSVTIDFNTGANGPTAMQTLDRLCAFWGYSGADTTPAKSAFVKSKFAEFGKACYVAAVANADAETARLAGKAAAELITVS
jgi:hypothetical protein